MACHVFKNHATPCQSFLKISVRVPDPSLDLGLGAAMVRGSAPHSCLPAAGLGVGRPRTLVNGPTHT